jgi:U6 snRNA phosphodiesterase
MALVDYSDSDSDHESSHINASSASLPTPSSSFDHTLKRKRSQPDNNSQLPPLPDAFRDLYSTNTRVSTRDDPTLHGGRKRAVPHVEGNWPIHVYLECKSHILPRLAHV